MTILLGCGVGFLAWFIARFLATGFYTVDQNERAVKTRFGRAERVGTATTLNDPIAQSLQDEERQRYCYPQVRVVHGDGAAVVPPQTSGLPRWSSTPVVSGSKPRRLLPLKRGPFVNVRYFMSGDQVT